VQAILDSTPKDEIGELIEGYGTIKGVTCLPIYFVIRNNDSAMFNVFQRFSELNLRSHRELFEKEQLLRIFVAFGMRPEIQYGGDTFLHLATKSLSAPLFAELFERSGVDVNAKDSNGCTFFHLAAGWDKAEVVEFLLKQKDTDVNLSDSCGNTPLHIASCCLASEARSIVSLLLGHADTKVNEKNGDKNTALHLVVKSPYVARPSYIAHIREILQLFFSKFKARFKCNGKNGQCSFALSCETSSCRRGKIMA
jgi:ankyrin repeat protein